MCYILLLTSISVLHLQAEENESPLAQIENLVWQEILRYYDDISRFSTLLGVESNTVCAILYVEKIQYELDTLRSMKKNIEEFLSTHTFFTQGITKWAALSVGFTHIKYHFAEETKKRIDELNIEGFSLFDEEVSTDFYINSPETAIKITVAGLKVFQEEWRTHPKGVDISHRPDILATLYNLGYSRSYPHDNPRPGGSYLPMIYKGRLMENYSFGEKVAMICGDKEYLAGYLP